MSSRRRTRRPAILGLAVGLTLAVLYLVVDPPWAIVLVTIAGTLIGESGRTLYRAFRDRRSEISR